MAGPKNARSYAHYLKIDELTRLQECLSEPVRHDETLFIVVHQVHELWFKQMIHEVGAITALLGRDDVRPATRLLRRLCEIQRVLIQQIAVLETMTPVDFLEFRAHLEPASGLGSLQFRELEILSGLREAGALALALHARDEAARARIRACLARPSLVDGLDACLRARGLEVGGDDPSADPRDLRASRLGALETVYLEAARHYDLYVLCETLIEYDENFRLWRYHHLQMVERMIGRRPGTGGTEGAAYLEKTLSKTCFPELWAVRTRLTCG